MGYGYRTNAAKSVSWFMIGRIVYGTGNKMIVKIRGRAYGIARPAWRMTHAAQSVLKHEYRGACAEP